MDTDSDGISDYYEVRVYSTDPNDNDSDNDGLSDGDEINVHGTDPNALDTDVRNTLNPDLCVPCCSCADRSSPLACFLRWSGRWTK